MTTTLDTTVITVGETDYGLGESDRVTFVDTKYRVDEHDNLHVYSDLIGNVGSFPREHWRAVSRGGSYSYNGAAKNTEVHQ